ncbi:MAG: DeoR/GlpR family DNA-binding transcription regulator [Opitutaceae bacterium]|nr:DeoR/GlpR family DNA-binding transcription regulator [Opitutaceae bacterium]
MFAHDRHRLILDALKKRASLGIAEIGKMLAASPATVRRDLVFLEKAGKIVRAHGAAVHPARVNGEVSFDRRSRAAIRAKTAIAGAAAALVREGDAVFVDGGSTTFEAGRRLLAVPGIILFTNSIPLLAERPAAEGARLVSIGGEVRAVSRALVGAGAVEWAGRLSPDIAFLGASGIDLENGPCTTELFEAGVKRAVAARARRVALLADASKWARPAAVRYADWAQIHDVFTDRRPAGTVRALLARHGVRLHVVRA